METCQRLDRVEEGEPVLCLGDIVNKVIDTERGRAIVEVCSKCGKPHSLTVDVMKERAGPLYLEDDESDR